VIVMALIGGLAAATLVNASLVIAVIVSLVIGVIGAVVVFRSPAREPALGAPRTATMPRGQPRPAGLNRAAAPPVLTDHISIICTRPPGRIDNVALKRWALFTVE
jgi:hypothetical protein